MTVADEAHGVRLVVTAGQPTDEELAALTVVLLGQAAAAAAAAAGTGRPRPSGWARAARLEALGERPLSSAADPRLRSR